MCMPDILAKVLIIDFLQLIPPEVLSPYEYQREVNFGGLTLDPDPASDPYLGCNFLTLI